MNRLNKLFAFIDLLILVSVSIACDNDSSSSEGRAISENDFFDDPSMTANPELDTVIK